MDLSGKTALITGGAKRLGKAMALALAQAGCNVIIHYKNSENEARQTTAELQNLGVQAWLIRANLADEAAVIGLIPAVLRQTGRLEILIHNASVFKQEDFFSATPPSWDEAMRVNLKAPFLLSQAFARALPAHRQGKIITLLDVIAQQPQNHHFSYTLSKAALQGLTQAMAVALAPQNIQVNAVAAGAILPAEAEGPALFEKLSRRIPAGRTGSPADVVNALLYLLQTADFVTGETIRVDGGRHLV